MWYKEKQRDLSKCSIKVQCIVTTDWLKLSPALRVKKAANASYSLKCKAAIPISPTSFHPIGREHMGDFAARFCSTTESSGRIPCMCREAAQQRCSRYTREILLCDSVILQNRTTKLSVCSQPKSRCWYLLSKRRMISTQFSDWDFLQLTQEFYPAILKIILF